MEVLYYLVPLAILLAALFVAAFRWAARTDQFEDLDTPAIRILLDDEEVQTEKAAQINPIAATEEPNTVEDKKK